MALSMSKPTLWNHSPFINIGAQNHNCSAWGQSVNANSGRNRPPSRQKQGIKVKQRRASIGSIKLND